MSVSAKTTITGTIPPAMSANDIATVTSGAGYNFIELYGLSYTKGSLIFAICSNNALFGIYTQPSASLYNDYVYSESKLYGPGRGVFYMLAITEEPNITYTYSHSFSKTFNSSGTYSINASFSSGTLFSNVSIISVIDGKSRNDYNSLG